MYFLLSQDVYSSINLFKLFIDMLMHFQKCNKFQGFISSKSSNFQLGGVINIKDLQNLGLGNHL